MDCADGSDEFKCTKVSVPPTYNREFAPKPDKDTLARVNASIRIASILELDEVESNMEVKFW